MPLVSSVSRAWTLTMSLSARTSSNESSEAPTARAAAGSAKGSWASTRLPKAASSWAMREPTAPRPISPTAAEHSGCRFRRRPAPWSRDTGPEADVGKMPAPASHPRPPTCPYCRGCDSAGANAFQTEWGRRGSTRHGRRQGIGQPDVTAGGPGHRGADPNGSANTAVRVGSSPTPPAIVKSTVCGTVRSFVGKATSTVVGAG